jgi:N-carbamoyl-L-amino-acid hydrolase
MNRREFGAAIVGGAFSAGSAARIAAGVGASGRESTGRAGVDPRILTGARAAPAVNGARLNAHLREISRFGANPQGGVSRVAYSDADRDARALVMQWMREAQLTPSVDAAANIIGRRAGTEDGRKPLVFGSHVDSVPEGGNYDGNLGSLAAIEVAQTLNEKSIRLRHPIEVAVWSNEEGGLYGSRAVSGQLTAAELKNVANSRKTIEEGIAFLGGNPAQLDRVKRARGDIAGYFELHIEQGGILEQTKVDIGIVEGIVGIRQWDVTITGFANHAGTTPMDQRHDAMLSAARFTDMVNRVVRSVPGRQVGTVGRIQAFPGAPNVIPGKVVCSLELRDLDDTKIATLFAQIQREARTIGDALGTTFEYKDLHVNVSAPTDARMRDLIAQSAKDLSLSTRLMPSGAGHDAQAMAQLGPMGMIFVPSVGGISHSPKEYTKPEDCVNGANVLLGAVLRADQTLDARPE